MMPNINIAVVGLGYVGLPLAISFGQVRPLVAYDIDTKRVKELIESFDKTGERSRKIPSRSTE